MRVRFSNIILRTVIPPLYHPKPLTFHRLSLTGAKDCGKAQQGYSQASLSAVNVVVSTAARYGIPMISTLADTGSIDEQIEKQQAEVTKAA